MSASTITVPVFVSKPNIADEDFLPMWDVVGAGMKKLTYLELKTDIFTTDALDTEIFFNNAGIIDGDPRLTYDPGLNILSLQGDFNINGNNIINTGTLTLPISTDTLVGRATVDTLTNKTFDSTSNVWRTSGTSTLTADTTISGAFNLSLDVNKTGIGTAVGTAPHTLHLPDNGSIGAQNRSSARLTFFSDTTLATATGGSIFLHHGAADTFELTNNSFIANPLAYVASSGEERTLDITADITGQTGTANFTGIYMNILDTGWSGGFKDAMILQNDGENIFQISSSGFVTITGQMQNSTSTFWQLSDGLASATVPNIIHNRSRADTGIGGVAGEIDLITTSLSRLNITDTLITSSVDLDMSGNNISNTGNIVFGTGQAIRTGQSPANSYFFQVYDTDAPGHVTWATATANNSPSVVLVKPAGGTLTISSSDSITTDSLTMQGAIDMGTNIIDQVGNLIFGTGGAIRTGQSAFDNYFFQVYDSDAPGHVTWATITAEAAPSVVLNKPAGGSLTISSSDAITTDSLTMAGSINIGANNIVTDTTTGMQLWTAAAQKGGFWGAVPIVQPLHIADPTGGGTIDAEARTAINAINALLASTGLSAAA